MPIETARQTQAWWQRQYAARELARAVAFANVRVEPPVTFGIMLLGEVAAGPFHGTCRYAPFRDEIARALRISPARIRTLIGGAPKLQRDGTIAAYAEHDWHWAFRPIGGATTGDLNEPMQANIRALFDAIINCRMAPVLPILWGLRTYVEVAIPPLRPRKPGRHPLWLRRIDIPTTGYDSLRLGVVLGTDFFHRLARCQTCGHFILGKTDRPVRYCADPKCQARASKPSGKPPTQGAAYTRAHRERLSKWASHRLTLISALGGSPARSTLERLLREGRKLVEECFRWRRSPGRVEAEALLRQAKDRIRTLRAGN